MGSPRAGPGWATNTQKHQTHRNREYNGYFQGLRNGGNQEMYVKVDYKLSVIWVSSGDLRYSVVAVVNNTILYK